MHQEHSVNYHLSPTFLLPPHRLASWDALKFRTSILHFDEVYDKVIKKDNIKNIFNRVGIVWLACGAERYGVGNLELPHHAWMP